MNTQASLQLAARSAGPLVALLVLAAAAGSAQAATVLFHDDVASFNAAAGPLINADFAAAAVTLGVTDAQPFGVLDPGSVTIGAAEFQGLQAGNAAGFLVQNTYNIAGPFYTHQVFTGVDNEFVIQFAQPVTAFGFYSNVFNATVSGAPGPVGLSLTLGNGDSVDTFTTPYYDGVGSAAPGTAPVVFNGLVSNTAFSSLVIHTTAQAIDVTAFSLAPVPEPQSWALLLAGLCAIGGTLQRRRAAIER